MMFLSLHALGNDIGVLHGFRAPMFEEFQLTVIHER